MTETSEWIDRLPKRARIAVYIVYLVALAGFLYLWWRVLCQAG